MLIANNKSWEQSQRPSKCMAQHPKSWAWSRYTADSHRTQSSYNDASAELKKITGHRLSCTGELSTHTELQSAIHTYYGMTCFFYLFILFIAILVRWGLLFLLAVLKLKIPQWHRALCAVDVRLLQLNGSLSSKQFDFFSLCRPVRPYGWWVNCCVCSINASHVIAYARHYVVISSFCHRLSQNASRDAENMHVTHTLSSEPEPPTTMAQIEKKHITQNPNPLRHSFG